MKLQERAEPWTVSWIQWWPGSCCWCKRGGGARNELWCWCCPYKTFTTSPNHISFTLFIRLLLLSSLLSLSILWDWKESEINSLMLIYLNRFKRKVKVNWNLRQTWVRHMFSRGAAELQPARRQNGTILGKFRWKTKTSCFDAKLVLTQPSASVEVSWRREGSRLKTSCFAQRKSTITTAAQLWEVSSAGQSCFDWKPPWNFQVQLWL